MNNDHNDPPRTAFFIWRPVVKKDGESFPFQKYWGNASTTDLFEKLPQFMRGVLGPDIVVDEDICHYYVDFSQESPRVIFQLEVGDISLPEFTGMLGHFRDTIHRKKRYYNSDQGDDDDEASSYTIFLKLESIH